MNTTHKQDTGLAVAGLMLGLFMAALDQTIISTAMTQIIAKLGGFDKFVWVYSAYMIAMVVCSPIFGKLSDMYGRKRFFLAGLLVFTLGSILCGTAQNMEQLIIYRGIQGIGGGAVTPIVFAIIFDMFPPERRGKMMGLFGAVFGISNVFGPIMGGAITDQFSWRWVFYINVPIALLSFIFILRAYHESGNHKKQIIDWTGAVALAAAVLCLMFGLELGGSEGWAWDSWNTIGLFVASLVLTAVFLRVEQTAKDPIIAFRLFRDRVFTSSMIISLVYGAAMIGVATYIPVFIQGVFHKTATETSTVLTPMLLGVVLSSQIGGRIAGKFRYRSIMLVSAAVLFTGLMLLGYAMDASTSRGLITLYMVVVGLGIGVSFSLLSISTISSVPPQYKGSASSLITFFRTIGSALGVTVFGAMQKHVFQGGLAEIGGLDSQAAEGIKGGQALLDPAMQARMGLSGDVVEALLGKLADSILYLFQWSVLLPIVAVVFAILMGRAGIEAAKPNGAEGRAEAATTAGEGR
ncbi:MDR family MFS transporter [Paenibacillus methanolicus]|uniref:EmrB/QacA subfamily drug resistance transporter n=1 Tax=Paenibacillus methanolicus TaxID=582686 RepID=A0A5S5BPM5_9BACL|nr:MDR family MFS transporter [Paenibacillus methanolicus]TYP68082.1 EmrB/QacA subfamily drug resistance transporter [Paenibacillus methanolicus]